jgi:hypothetical protein
MGSALREIIYHNDQHKGELRRCFAAGFSEDGHDCSVDFGMLGRHQAEEMLHDAEVGVVSSWQYVHTEKQKGRWYHRVEMPGAYGMDRLWLLVEEKHIPDVEAKFKAALG